MAGGALFWEKKHILLFFKKNYNIINIINIKINDNTPECFKTKIIDLVQYINNLGNYVNYEWFLNLNKQNKVIFIREIIDIWNYRAQLTEDIKRDIYPTHGDPFFDIFNYNSFSISEDLINDYIIKIVERITKSSNNRNNQILGANYILCALTLVNETAATTYPWLYQSVSHY